MHNFFSIKIILIFRRFFNSANRFYVYGRDGIYEYDWKHQTYRLLLPANGLSLDGMQVDAAGNIYFCEPGQRTLCME